MKTRIILVRHAEAEGNANRVFHGWTDSSITEKGHLQAAQVAERLRNTEIDVIYSSTLKRAVQTAQHIADIKGLPIIKTDLLKEINGGNWEDVSWIELAKKWPKHYFLWENFPHLHRMPEGESMEEMFLRIVGELKKIVEINKGKRICIVTHGTAIKALMCHLKGCSLDEMLNIPWHENTSVSVFDYDEDTGVYIAITEGDASHLKKSMGTLQNQDWWIDLMKDGGGAK